MIFKGMYIPEDKIEEIRVSVDIVDYINQFIPLKKVGKNYVGLCPFHIEKTPSFTVSPDKQLYHCFGCGAGGNVFNFVMQYEKVSFFESVRKIAEYAGIDLPKPEKKASWVITEFEELYEANRFAEEFFARNLIKTAEGKRAMEYLYRRGVNDASIKNFGIGYAPEQWDALVQHAIKHNFSLELLEKAGLIIKREDGAYYDRFRDRVMFPIFSLSGRIIAFGGRRLKEDENIPKYINSPETKIYTKGKVLYGLYQARDAIRKKGFAILVEGYMDCISLFQAGIENVIASGGTALTDEQVKLISNYTDKIYFLYDADSAGARAMVRGIDIILAHGLEVYIVKLPDGEDPDSFIRKKSVSEFEKLLEDALDFIEFKALTYQQLGKFNDPNVRAKAIRSLVTSISKVPDQLKRGILVHQLSSKYKLPERVLAYELELTLLEEKKALSKKTKEKRTEVSIENKYKLIPPEERDLVKILFDADELGLEFIFKYLEPTDITSEQVKEIYQSFKEMFRQSKELGEYKKLNIHEFILKFNDDEIRSFITNIVLSKYEAIKYQDENNTSDVLWKAVDDILTRFYLRKIRKIKERLTSDIAEAEKSGNREKIDEIVGKISYIGKREGYLIKRGFEDIIKKYLQGVKHHGGD